MHTKMVPDTLYTLITQIQFLCATHARYTQVIYMYLLTDINVSVCINDLHDCIKLTG